MPFYPELQHLGSLGVLDGYDGKPLLYGLLAAAGRDGACKIRGSEIAAQLASIEASTLNAPDGLMDYRADAYALAVTALAWQPPAGASILVAQTDPLQGYDRGTW